MLQVEADLAGAEVRSAVADGYKAGELLDVSPWPLALVRSGIGPSGSAAVRAFQRAVLTRTIATVKNYSLTNAIAESTLRRDGNGNPATGQGAIGGPDRRAQCGGSGGGRGGVVPRADPDGRLHTQTRPARPPDSTHLSPHASACGHPTPRPHPR